MPAKKRRTPRRTKKPAEPRYTLPPGAVPREQAGSILLHYRQAREYSQRAAALAHGIAFRSWQNYEQGKRDAPRALLYDLVTVLNDLPPRHPTP